MGIKDEIQFYTDWVNNELRLSWKSYCVKNLIEEFGNGCSLVEFINAIFDEKLPIVHKHPSTFLEREQNAQICLKTLSEENVNLTGVTATGIAFGDVDVILTLCAAIKRKKGVGFRRGGVFGTSIDFDEQDVCYQGKVQGSVSSFLGYEDSSSLSRLFDSGIQSNSDSFGVNADIVNQSKNMTSFGNQSKNVVSKINQSENSDLINKRSAMKGSRRIRDGFQNRSNYREVSFLLSDSQRQRNGNHIVCYSKHDMALFEWISNVLDIPIQDYGSFADGIVLYQLLCKIIPNCISPKVFYSSDPIQRIQLVLETASHELYFNTTVSANDVHQQRNFSAFRILLTYLKSFYPKVPNRRAHKSTLHSSTFTLDDLRNVCEIELSEPRSQHVTTGNNPKRITLTKDTFKRIETHNLTPDKEVKQKKTLPTLPDSKPKFVSPTWTKILNEELQMRASRKESRLSDVEVSVTPERKENIGHINGPSYTRDTERITKYDNEIAAIFEANESDEESDDSKRFDLTGKQKRAMEHSTATSTPVSSGSKLKNKFLDITSEVRSLSRSPSGSRNA